MKPVVLIFVATYLPGFKSGGPVRSISNLVEALGDEFDFRVVTSDRDAEDVEPYPCVRSGAWTTVGKAQVLYLRPEDLGLRSIYGIVASQKADFLYLNSLLNRPFSIFPMLARAAGARGQRRVVLAPRGECAAGALGLKHARKRAWIGIARRIGAYRGARWHASSQFEAADIRRVIGCGLELLVASPLPPRVEASSAGSVVRPPKSPGTLRIVFLARLSPVKNLSFALRMLSGVSGNIELNIYGPVSDRDYWQRCERDLRSLPPNIRVSVNPQLEHAAVRQVLSSQHLYLLPSLGESFGHGIYESLCAGCPVLISDRTPWRGLEPSGAGWELPLDREDLFQSALRQCVEMDDARFAAASLAAQSFARNFAASESLLDENRALFAG